MTLFKRIALYDPNRLDADDFLAGFVAREDLAAFLLDKLRKLPVRTAGEHQLIVGPRGMGKTSLLRRLALGIGRDPDLSSRYVPLTFREEQYNVRSLDRFWRNCGEALAEWADTVGRTALAAEIDRCLCQPEWKDAASAAEAFLARTKALGRPVLFVDNLDLILDALPPDEHWALRRILQAPGGPILYGAATHFPSQTGDRNAAFYEFFQPHALEPLSEAELLHCMRRFAELRGEAGKRVRDILAKEPERLRTLHALTGGNPRVLALIYQLLERAETDTVFSDLESLLDQLTPYYKARVEEYQSDMHRAIIDAIALHWDPITSHDLARKTDIKITTLPSQLDRLQKDGLVEDVPTSGARAGYQLVERFFNIWYLMRHGTRRTRLKMRWLTAFLRSFYAPGELSSMRAEAERLGPQAWHPLYREAILATADEGTYVNLADGAQPRSIASPSNRAGVPASISVADELMAKARTLVESDQLERAVSVLNEVASRFADAIEPSLRAQVAFAFYNKGVALGELGRTNDAIATYDDVVARFAGAPEPTLRQQAAWALLNKGYTLGDLGRHEDAIAAYDDVVARFAGAAELTLRQQAAWALLNKGYTLGDLGRHEDAIAAYDDVVTRFAGAAEPVMREQIAMALVSKGHRFGALGRHDDAFAAYNDVVSRFADATEPALREQVANALFGKGVRLGDLGRHDDTIAAYDDVVARFADAAEPALREMAAKALVNKGNILGDLGRHEDAIAAYNDVVARFTDSAEPPLREVVAGALVNKGASLGALGRLEDAIAAYDDVVVRVADATEPALREFAARALVNKGLTLGALSRHEDAIAAYDDIVLRFAGAAEPGLREWVVWAFLNKSRTLDDAGKVEEGLATLRRAAEFAPSNAMIGCLLGNVLVDRFGRHSDAEAIYRRFENDGGDVGLVVRANLAWLLVGTGRHAEAADLLATLDGLAPVGRALLDAALELTADNFGSATHHLGDALASDAEALKSTFSDDVLRLLRIAEARGYGEKLIAWFEESGHADRQAPVYAALVAFVRGERFLRDVNPEVRGPAQKIFDWLTRQRRYLEGTAEPQPAPKRRRGRPSKRRKA
ncbi:tetratricopeptide repeat protein [Xanthobacteraceae bacterium Astr-EGSB]|uniref:tetratricopeptide repeat protein n=1 Tax=Astrobacterium formosum TaxID=3069710 RepID=UPI0027B4654C|nr:tetratricopeptide repeat protein [Xanthobacteraceae bacterium Astr-EGSB]